MIRIAIVEDCDADAEAVEVCLEKLAKESGETFHTEHFRHAELFLTNYKPIYDIVLMDIEMPGMNGMKASQRLRLVDKDVVIIFITNMRQYAVKGYEVGALDFIVKPVTYYAFRIKMTRALSVVRKLQKDVIAISTKQGMVRLSVADIDYIEVFGHNIRYKTSEGDFEARSSLAETEKIFEKYGFLRCNNCFLVNPRNIKRVSGSVIYIGGDEISISRPRRKEFLEALADYFERERDE